MTVRDERIDIDLVLIPAVMAPDDPVGGAAASPFGIDTIELPAVLVPQDHDGRLPGDPFFLAGSIENTGAAQTPNANAPNSDGSAPSGQYPGIQPQRTSSVIARPIGPKAAEPP